MENRFHEKLREKIDTFVHEVYRVTKSFPREELYNATSQLRRAALSVALNYVEGYARQRHLVVVNFLEISYGSLKESKYLIEFSWKEKWMSTDDHTLLHGLAEEIGAMLWKTTEYARMKSESI